jgi:hypothetical protein
VFSVYRTCAEFDEMFHVPKSTNSNEILDVNEICDQALGHAVADVNEEAVENGTILALLNSWPRQPVYKKKADKQVFYS